MGTSAGSDVAGSDVARSDGRVPGSDVPCWREQVTPGAGPRIEADAAEALPFSLPEGLRLLSETPDGAAWLARVPHLLENAIRRWRLEVSAPFSAGSASWTALARRRGSSVWSLVLKISYPHPEAAQEADALVHWHGHGAPRLVDVAPEDWALLMHAVRPGTPLSASMWPETAALRAGGRVLAELYATPLPPEHPFGSLADTVAEWARLVSARAAEHRWAAVDDELVVAWHETVELLLATAPPPVLLHGDANPGNLLAAEDGHRMQWFAIDPKAVVGDPAFDPWPMLEQIAPDPFGASDGARALVARCELIAPLIGTTPWRVAAWSFVRRVESILWLADLATPSQRPEWASGLVRQWGEVRTWWTACSLLAGTDPEVARTT